MVAAEGLDGVPDARDLAVEREADRVEHARLARAGLPVDQEQPGVGQHREVDLLGAGERPERGDLEFVQSHTATRGCGTLIFSSCLQYSNASFSTARSASSA